MPREMLVTSRYRFLGDTGYILPPGKCGNGLIALGHTASVPPWADPDLHWHGTAEEYFFLRQGELLFWIAGLSLSLRANELLVVRPEIPHAVVGARSRGTPIWGRCLTGAARAYIERHKDHFKAVAFFRTGLNPKPSLRCFQQMEQACGKAPRATANFDADKVNAGDFAALVQEFVSRLV